MSRLTPRVFVTGGVAAMALLLTAGPASAHVSVSAEGATQGGFATVTFNVPTESETASTTGLKIQLPPDQPLAVVSVKPHSGWSYTVSKTKLATPIQTDEGEMTEAVSVIDWNATSAAAGIKPGEFDEFVISVGPLPKADSIVFKAIQTYSDGKTVQWIDEPAPGSTAEPEFPAPTLKLVAPAAPTPAASAPAATSGAASSTDDSTGAVVGAYIVGGVGLVAAIAALALAAGARRQRATVVGEDRSTVTTGTE
jgi:periplasmic copper chaperone A